MKCAQLEVQAFDHGEQGYTDLNLGSLSNKFSTRSNILPLFSTNLKFEIVAGNSLEVLKGLEDNSMDSIISDPPYEIGFMGRGWDSTGIAFNVELWRQCLRILKPGGYLLAFSAAKMYHRIACAIEDSGFEIRDQIMWIYGSGFPKSQNLHGDWEGWGTALKPAHEPIVMARKPLVGTVLKNLSAYGVGAIHIDSARVPTSDKLGGGRLSGPTKMATTCGGDEWDRPWMNNLSKRDEYAALTAAKVAKAESLGRWPANVIHDGSDGVLNTFELGDTNSSAAKFFYCAKPDKKDKNDGLGAENNNHPTVKPTHLMRYLCKLVTPPNGLVLDPFAGSGSTGRGAVLEGFRFFGIELDPVYAKIAKSRIEAAAKFTDKGCA